MTDARLTHDEFVTALERLTDAGHDLKLEVWGYRTHTGAVTAALESKREWRGPVAYEVYVRDIHLPHDELLELLALLESMGLRGDFNGLSEEGLRVTIAPEGQTRFYVERRDD